MLFKNQSKSLASLSLTRLSAEEIEVVDGGRWCPPPPECNTAWGPNPFCPTQIWVY